MPDKDNHHPPARTDTPLWRFALALWQEEAAPELFLQLQEQGWSVTRLLCAGWLATRGVPYSGAEPQGVQQWRRDVTESIRSLKKSLSKSDSLLASLRESLAKAELEAERVELYRAWLAIGTTTQSSQPVNMAQVAEINLRQAAPENGGAINEVTESMIRQLAKLIDTAFHGEFNHSGGQQA